MKKILASILVSSVVLSAFASCASVDETNITPVYSSSSSVSVYGDWLKDRLTADGELTEDTEIIIGNATDAEAYDIDMSNISDDGYVIRRLAGENSTLIFGKTNDAVDMAVRYYANYCDKTGPINVTEGEGYRVGSITIAGADLSEYVIVCPADADDNQKFAASELKRFLGDACGIYPEIVTESDGYAITLVRDVTGETYGDEAFNIKSHEKGITITGGRWRGCMYGVYSFLEQYIGYRFYYADIAKKSDVEAATAYLYKADSIVIGTDVDHSEFPSIHARDTHGGGTSSPALKHNGWNMSAYGGKGVIAKACHGYANNWIPDWEIQEMGYNVGYSYGINPCYTDEDLNSLLIERVINYCKEREASIKQGNIPTIDVAQHDIGSFCQCSSCTKIYSKYGGYSGATVNLGNMVAEALCDAGFTEVPVAILAYYGTDKPPKNIEIHENLYISYCFYVTLPADGYMVCGNHSINGTECSTNKYFADLYDGWAALTDNLYVWYYPFQAYYLAYSSPYTFNIYDDIKYLAEAGTYGIFFHAEGDSINQTYDSGLINFYMGQRMMWNANITEEEYHEMLKEFLFLAYGDGYEFVYDYIKIIETAADMQDCFCGFHTAIMHRLDFSYIKDNIPLLRELHENAVRLARTSHQEELCNRLFGSVYYYELIVLHTDMWVNGDDASKAEYKEKVDSFITTYPKFPIGEMGLGTPTYAPSLSEVDYDVNPIEWTYQRLGGWNDDYNF